VTEFLINNLDENGEGRAFKAHGHALIADAGAVSLMRGTFEPGWKWSEDVKPLAGTDSCKVRHLGYVLSGSMAIRMDDGSQSEVRAGDVFDLAPGHDAWVTSDVACEMIDVSSDATKYATSRSADVAPADDQYMSLARRGYAAFNSADVATLTAIFADDVVQHVPGNGPFAGTYKGTEAVLGYYGKLAEATDGTFRAHLLEVHGDGHGHVTAVHQMSAERDGQRRVSRGSLLLTCVGDKVTDLLELHADLPGDDAFFS
jgi:ketosteroid isomerase-like protein